MFLSYSFSCCAPEIRPGRNGSNFLPPVLLSRPDLFRLHPASQSLPCVNSSRATAFGKRDQPYAPVPALAVTGCPLLDSANRSGQVATCPAWCDCFSGNFQFPRRAAGRCNPLQCGRCVRGGVSEADGGVVHSPQTGVPSSRRICLFTKISQHVIIRANNPQKERYTCSESRLQFCSPA